MKPGRNYTIIAAATLGIAAAGICGRVASAQQPISVGGETSYADGPAATTSGSPKEIPINFPRQITAEVFNGAVLRVVDGATIVVERDGKTDHSRPETIRLYGLTRPAAGNETKTITYLNDNLKGSTVRVEGRRRRPDGTLEALVTEMPKRNKGVLEAGHTDSSGVTPMAMTRTMGSAGLPSGATPPLNVALVRLGLARYDASIATRDQDFADRLSEAEEGARKDKSGLWANVVVASPTGSATSAVLPPGSGEKR